MMQLKPYRLLSGSLRVILHENDGLIIELEAQYPASAKGRKAWLFLDANDVTELLLELRESAIEARR